MSSSKQKTIKSMFSSKSVKKVRKAISRFFLFNEGIHRSEESRSIRETDDDNGEDVRVLSSSSSDDDENGDDNDDSDGGDGDDDNNGDNNSDDGGTCSLEAHMPGLSLIACQHYGMI